ncbi:NAD(P)H-flavin reductase/hemoglobin-like flavoprotein [Catenulispora sp. GAS73]|uniref:globin domain-containing protein n=1 Tax=Catenulispora sp. GAS73 TaxID=3156269 RepID=UPI0035138B34
MVRQAAASSTASTEGAGSSGNTESAGSGGSTGRAGSTDLDPARVPALIRESFTLVADCADQVLSHFYALLFTEDPALRDMFPPMMDAQRDRLFQALVHIVGQAEHPDGLADYLRDLGRDHRKYGARPEHYDVVWRCLISALKRYAGAAWTPDMDAAWLAAYQLVAGTMIEAAEQDAKLTPAWWSARVVGHELRTSDIAVITLAPDAPYAFRAGQYLSLETQRWPRVWRHFSIANAPRHDNTLTLHVRAIPAGWVSTALVSHTKVGDVVRLGPPSGTMLCNSQSMRDLLCIAGGTGLAPIKAMVEDMATWNTTRQVRLFYGARHDDELYDLAELERLAYRRRWLSVVSAVSHDPRYPGERGMLPDVVARYGEFFEHWAGHDVYVSGSVPMVRATIARLQELNIPLASIRFDAYGGMDELWQPGAGQGVPMPPTAPAGPGTGVEAPLDVGEPEVSGRSSVGSAVGSWAGSRNGWRKDGGWRAGVSGQVRAAETLDEWLLSQAS